MAKGDMAKGIKSEQIKDWLADADLDPPFGVSAARWQIFLADARKFVADGWLDRAIKLEWLDLECFGVDPDQPFDNPAPGRTGLVTALAGRVVMGLHPDYATIKNASDEDGRLHSRWLQVQSRHAKQKLLVGSAPAFSSIQSRKGNLSYGKRERQDRAAAAHGRNHPGSGPAHGHHARTRLQRHDARRKKAVRTFVGKAAA